MITLWNWFVKITGWPAALLVFRTKVYYEDRKAQGRFVKGPAIIISNHTSVFDYAVYMFVFFFNTLRVQMAEVLFQKKPLGLFLRMLGGIYVDRDSKDFGFISKSEEILAKGGVVGIFPEGRIPLPGEETPLEFKTSAAYIALSSGARIIPVVTDGSYFGKKRAHVLIGKPIGMADLLPSKSGNLPQREEILEVTEKLRQRIAGLKETLDERIGK